MKALRDSEHAVCRCFRRVARSIAGHVRFLGYHSSTRFGLIDRCQLAPRDSGRRGHDRKGFDDSDLAAGRFELSVRRWQPPAALCAEAFRPPHKKFPCRARGRTPSTAKNRQAANACRCRQNRAKHDAAGSGLLRRTRRPVGLRGALLRYSRAFSSRWRGRRPALSRSRRRRSTLAIADIAAVKRVIEAARKGTRSGSRRGTAAISDPRRAQAGRMDHPAQRQHQAELPALRRLHRRQSELAARRRCSAAAPRTRCGTTASTMRPCAPSSPSSSRPPPRAATCWRARCSRKATAPAPQRWCARPGATTTARARCRSNACSRCSATCSRRADHKARMETRLYADDADGRHARRRTSRRQRARDRARPRRRHPARPATPRRCSTPCRPRRAATPAISFARAVAAPRTTSRRKPAS